MTDDTTHASTDGTSPTAPAPDQDVLVLAWSRAEPHRCGEIAIPAAGRRSVLGRGTDEPPGEARLRFFRQRPGILEPAGALLAPGLSRRQLILHPAGDGFAVERVGRCPVEVNGIEREDAPLVAGDVVSIGRELVLLCVRRPGRLPPLRHAQLGSACGFGEPDRAGILGESPAAWELRDALAFAARADAHVLVVGESGTGKELVARALHELSPRCRRPFVARNAATLPPGLVDAELFGHARNYPNAGMPERHGLVGDADGGTLFLDEIGELGPELQAHLLRLLDDGGDYQRLGDSTQRRASLRVVAATNRGAAALKHDLVARFTATVEVPSLAARREDIPLLARALVLRAAQRSPDLAGRFVVDSGSRPDVRLSGALVAHLLRRAFPGNVRELEAVLWRAIAESGSDALDVPSAVRGAGCPVEPAPQGEPAPADIRRAIERAGGSVTRAARALGLSSRFALYRLMRKHGLVGGDARGRG
jgi:two-component system nitrogen regulation response regulator GlnG/two-component system response regulator HydG